MKSDASNAEEYLQSLPEDRRAIVSRLRDVILANLPEGYRESVGWGMLCYGIPLERYPNTYNKQPLGYLGLASQKNHVSLYVLAAYQDSEHDRWLREEFRKAGKKLDMGKCCIRFKKLDDLPMDVIARSIASVPPEKLIEQYEAVKGR
jgi:hypothetical protein